MPPLPCHSSFPRVARGGGGFTLIELVIVVALISVITAMVVPVYGASMKTIQLRNAQNDLVALLSFVQEKAVVESREYRFYLNPKDRIYWVEKMTGYDKEGLKEFEPVEDDWGVEHDLPDYFDVKKFKGRKDRARDAEYIVCYPNGACDRTEIVVHDSRTRRSEFTIRTLGGMGKIEVERKT